jgi:hypothetical protein
VTGAGLLQNGSAAIAAAVALAAAATAPEDMVVAMHNEVLVLIQTRDAQIDDPHGGPDDCNVDDNHG